MRDFGGKLALEGDAWIELDTGAADPAATASPFAGTSQ